MRYIGFLLVLAAWTSGTSAPAMAAEQKQAATTGETAFDDHLQSYYDHLGAKRYDAALAIIAKLKDEVANPQTAKAVSVLLSSPVAAARRRDEQARQLLAEGEGALSTVPEIFALVIPAYLVVERADFAGSLLDRLVGRAPDIARTLPPEWVSATLRDTGEAGQIIENRKVALAQMGYGGSKGDWLTAEAIGILVKRGDTQGATDLLRYLDSPREVENLLIDRRFAALWSKVAEQAGPRLAKSRASSVAAALQDLAANPSGAEELAELIGSYRYARRYDDAFKLRDRLPSSPAGFAKAEEHTGWAVNNMVLALHEAGRANEADALFAGLNSAVREDWRISMLINRVELLVTDGKFAQSLPLITEAEKVGKSPYAEQLLRRLRYCALSRLGRTAEAGRLRGDLLSHAKDAMAPTVDGLICTGELDAAEQLALGALNDDDFQTDFIRSLQAKPLTADDPSVWGGWTALRQRPAIAAAFSRLGRDLPDELRATATK